MSRHRPVLLATALVAATVLHATAQGPSVDLGKRTAKSKYTLGNLTALQELPDGRVIASDSKEGVFRLIDLGKGDVGIVGKQGDDPDTYRRASSIVPLPGDSLGLYDAAGRKLMHVSSQAAVGDFTPIPSPSSKRRLGQLLGGDVSGSLYFTVAAVMNFDTATKKVTGGTPGIATVTRVRAGSELDEPMLTYRTMGKDQLDVNGAQPFLFRDAVAFRRDGLVARVMADSYQVIWMRDGNETGRTGPLPFTPIPVTPAEQQAIKDSSIAAFKAMMANGGGPGGSRTMTFGDGGGGRAAAMGGGGAVTMVMIGGGGSGNVVVSGGGAPIQIDRAAGEARVAGGAGGPPGAAPGAAPNPADMQKIIDQMAARPYFFPANKPPMPSSGPASMLAMFDANGMLWVARERVRGDATPHYDVIAEGKGIVGRVNLPTGTRLLGFGKNSVYVARSEDGSDWLERYPMPKF